ncbi:unnamed protein product [Zymoseptoria tritici ST99CH_3D1]|nr:unnamed protein product [Zymoseptoria tritici ST99CH_3D1]
MVVLIPGLRNLTLAILSSIIFLTIYLSRAQLPGRNGRLHEHDAFSSVQAKNDFYGIPKTEFKPSTMAEESEKYFLQEASLDAKLKATEGMLKAEGAESSTAVKVEDDLGFPTPEFKASGGLNRMKRYAPHNFHGPGKPTFATYYSVPSTSLKEPNFVSILHLAYRLLWHPPTRSTKYPFTVFVAPGTSDAQRNVLIAMGCLVRELDPLIPAVAATAVSDMYDLPGDFDLLNLWSQTLFDRIAYLAPNVFITGPVDEIFDLATTRKCEVDRLGVEDREIHGTGKGLCRFVFAAVMKEIGEENEDGERAKEVDTGVMVLSPSLGMRRRLGREVGRYLGVLGPEKKVEMAMGPERARETARQRAERLLKEVPLKDLPAGPVSEGEKIPPGAAPLMGTKLKPGEAPVAAAPSEVADTKPVPGEAGLEAAGDSAATAPSAGKQTIPGEGDSTADEAASTDANSKSDEASPPLAGQQTVPGALESEAAPPPSEARSSKPDIRQHPSSEKSQLTRRALIPWRLTSRDDSPPPPPPSEEPPSEDSPIPTTPPTLPTFLTTLFGPTSAFPMHVLPREWNGFAPQGDDEGVLKTVNLMYWRDDGGVEWLRHRFGRVHEEMMEGVEGEGFRKEREGDGGRVYL